MNQTNDADVLWPSVCRIPLSSSLQTTYCVGQQEAVCDFWHMNQIYYETKNWKLHM